MPLGSPTLLVESIHRVWLCVNRTVVRHQNFGAHNTHTGRKGGETLAVKLNFPWLVLPMEGDKATIRDNETFDIHSPHQPSNWMAAAAADAEREMFRVIFFFSNPRERDEKTTERWEKETWAAGSDYVDLEKPCSECVNLGPLFGVEGGGGPRKSFEVAPSSNWLKVKEKSVKHSNHVYRSQTNQVSDG